MKSAAVAGGLILQRHLEALDTVRTALKASHRPPDDPEIMSAFELCRSAEMVLRHYPPGLNVRHYQGKVFGLDHSWLVFEEDQVILDVYPMLCGSGPLLVSTKAGSPWPFIFLGTPVPTLLEEVADGKAANL